MSNPECAKLLPHVTQYFIVRLLVVHLFLFTEQRTRLLQVWEASNLSLNIVLELTLERTHVWSD